MATNLWNCDGCGHRGPTATFETDDGFVCPKCKEEDYAFPYRLFQCNGCGQQGDQKLFFGEDLKLESGKIIRQVSQDLDPIKEQLDAECPRCGNIGKKYKQIE